MKNYKIYRNNSEVYEFVVDDTLSESLSGNKYASFTVISKEELDIKIGDYILVENEKYEIFNPVDIEESGGVFTYPLTFYWQGYKLNNSIITDEGATTFAYHGDVSDFMTLLVNSLNEDYPEFTLGTIENGSILDLNFDNSNCMSALQTICENAEMEWDIAGTVINVKKRIGEETDHVFEYGRNKGSYSVKLTKVANANITTRMIGKGGTLNLPAGYSSPDSPKRLNLGGEVLEKNVEKYGKITGVYTNENIYPRLINKTVLGVTVPENIEEAGSWKIKLDIPFNLSEYYADNEVPVVKFQTGDLTGVEFEIVENSWNNTDKTLSIITKEETDGYYLPNENRQPRVGDVFVLLNIYMPQSYIDEATEELRKATQDELDRKCEPQYAPSLSLQKHYVRKKNISLHIGDGITIKIGNKNVTTRIIGIAQSSSSDEINVELGNQMLYTYDTKVNNTLERIQTTLKQLISIEDIKRLFYNLINAWYPKWFNQKLHKDADVQFNSVKSDNIVSKNFTSGLLGVGHRLWNGVLEVSELIVRKSMHVFEIIVQKISSVNGSMLTTPGGGVRISAVEELGNGYKCFFDNDEGTIPNPFIVGDQALHQVFTGNNIKRYWRLVTSVGDDYFVLSKTDCEAGSGIPAAEDEVIQFGNRTDTSRQSGILTTSYGQYAPYTAYYSNVNSYSLEGKEEVREGNLQGINDPDFGQLAGTGFCGKNVYMKGVFRLMSGKTVEQSINDTKSDLTQTINNTKSDLNNSINSVQSTLNTSIGQVQSNLDNLKLGTENLISWKMMLEWNKKNKNIAVYGQDADGVYLGVNQALLYSNYGGDGSHTSNAIFNLTFKHNTQYVLSVEWKIATAQNYSGLAFVFEYTDGTNNRIYLGQNQTSKTIQHLVSEQGKTISRIGMYYGSSASRSLIYNISLIEGNKPLQGFPVATDDLPNNINLADGTKEFTVTSAGSNYTHNRLYMPKIKPNTAYYVNWGSVQNLAGNPARYTTIFYDKIISNNLAVVDTDTSNGGIIITKNNFTEQDGYLLVYAGVGGSTAGNSVKFTDVMLVEGRFPATTWTPSVNEQDEKIAEQGQKISALTTSVTQIQVDSNGIRQKVEEVEAYTKNGRIYARGTGRNRGGDATLYLNGNNSYNVSVSGRGFNVTVIRRSDFVALTTERFDVYGNGVGCDPFIAKLNSLNDSYIVVILSNDSAYFTRQDVMDALMRCGASGTFLNSRQPYALVGIPGIGKGNGIEVIQGNGSDDPYAEISCQVINGVPEGMNGVGSNLAQSEINQLKDSIDLKVSKGDIINQINLSTEGIRIDASKLIISGQTLFKDSGGNSVSIFGTGDNVFTINGGVFNVDKTGKLTASGVEISGTSTFGNLKVIGPYLLAKDSYALQFGAVGHSRNKITIGLGDPNEDTIATAISISHGGGGIEMSHSSGSISSDIVVKSIGALSILEGGSGNAIGCAGKCYFNLLSKSFTIENGYIQIENGYIQLNGNSYIKGFALNARSISSGTTLTNLDDVVFCTNSSEINLNLPASPKSGKTIWIRKEGSGKVNILGNGKYIYRSSDTSSQSMNDVGGLAFLVYNGSRWSYNFHRF